MDWRRNWAVNFHRCQKQRRLEKFVIFSLLRCPLSKIHYTNVLSALMTIRWSLVVYLSSNRFQMLSIALSIIYFNGKTVENVAREYCMLSSACHMCAFLPESNWNDDRWIDDIPFYSEYHMESLVEVNEHAPQWIKSGWTGQTTRMHWVRQPIEAWLISHFSFNLIDSRHFVMNKEMFRLSAYQYCTHTIIHLFDTGEDTWMALYQCR